ncbi:MAG: pre-peptidase C-terminal domain-containing protein [Blastocatellales bacterium]
MRNVFATLPSVFQGAENEQEPNEAPGQANAISIPGQKTGSATFGDAASFEFKYNNGPKDKIEDFFTFTIPTNQTRRLDITLVFNNAAADLDLLLFKEVNNNIQAIAVSNGSTTTERITPIVTLDEGKYYVGVSAFDDPGNTVSANYVLSVVPDTAPPPPTISAIVPQSVTAGGGPFSITVNGSNFISGQSVVRWDGQGKTTTFVTGNQLVAFLSAADTASPGTHFVTVFNPPSLGGQSAAVPFAVVPAGSPEPEVEPNETSHQASLLLAPGKRGGSVATGDAASTTIQLNNGLSDPVEDLFGLTLAQNSRLDLSLTGSNAGSNLALYLMKEIDSAGNFTVIGNSRFSGAVQRITTPAMLAPGRYLIGVSAVTGSSSYVIEASIPGSRLMQVNTSSAAPNSVATVPISFLSEGNERSFSFSLSFNPSALSAPQVLLGGDTGTATLNVNTSQVAQGRVGVEINLPQGQHLTSGAREIARVNFSIAPNPGSGSTAVAFADDPVVRGLVDPNGVALIGSYANGSVIVVPGFEADVNPRPAGNGSVSVADWTQVGNFVAGVDSPADGSEFQRADCAPKGTLGDGRLSVADWVMAGRYAAGLDTPAAAGGPAAVVSSLAAVEKEVDEAYVQRVAETEQQQTRTVRVVPATFNRGQTNTLVIELNSLGDEAGVGYSLNFDTTQLTFVSAAPGRDATGASFNVNSTEAAQGRVFIGLVLSSGQTFQTGARQIATITFDVPQSSSLNSTTVSFGDQPRPREIVDGSANALAATFTPGVITLNPQINSTPTLTGLNPATVIAGGPSFPLTITGTDFINGVVARVNGVDRATQFISLTEVRATILAQDIAETGTISVTVRNADPNTGVSNALNLDIVNPVPTLTSVSPNSAAVNSSAFTLQLTGTNFVPGATVQWNGANRLTTFVHNSNGTQLTAQIPGTDLQSAGTATIRVVNPAPGGGQSNAVNFTVASPSPIPRVTTISPTTIQAGSPDFMLTVNGSNFVNSSVVRINGNDLPTTVVGPTQLTAQVTSADIANPGNASITVFTPPPGGGMSNAAILQISVPPNPVPAITALNPNTVTAGTAQFTLTVTGSNFVQNSVVRFNGLDRTTNFVSPSEIRATITAGDIFNGGSATITVFNPAPAGGVSNALTLTINFAPPAITFLSPTSTVAGGPAFQLTVIGTNFAPGSVVRWNGEDRTTNFIGVTELNAQITAADIANVGSAQIAVFSSPPGGGLSNAITFNINQAARPIPRLTAIAPASAQAGGAAFTLMVTGQNFVSDSVVRWNGAARPTTFDNSTQLTATIPAEDIANVGNAIITVFTPPAGGGESNPLTFAINAPPNPLPAVTSINPSTVNAGGAAFDLTVNGSNFVLSSVVQLNGANRPTVFVNAGQLTARITAEDIVASGTAAIRVVSPAPGGGASNEVTLTIINPVPTITSLNPSVVAEGSAAFMLTVNGTNFVPGAQIVINGVPRITTFAGSTQLTTNIAASEVASPVTLNVQVVNPAPGGGVSNIVTLEARSRNPLPRVTTLSPSTVLAGGPDFVLVVNGTNFAPGAVARVNGQDRQTDLVSDMSLAVQIPASDIVAGVNLTINVVNPAPGGGMSNPVTLIVNNPGPRITSISPDFASAGSLEVTLVVNGSGFVPASVVRFAGLDLPTAFVTSSQLTATIPASLLTSGAAVSVVVANPAPGGGTSNAVTFSVTNPTPVITGLSPNQFLAGGPQFALTVNGSGFVNGSIVRVGGQDRQTAFINATQLTATVLASDIATGGTLNITVINPAPGGGVSNTATLTGINPVPTLSGLNPGVIAAGSAAFTLNVNGNGFVSGAEVYWNGSPRPTGFVNSGQLTAQISAADIANVGSASITVVNPAPGGGTSNALSFTISSQPNPAPVLASLSPASIAAGSVDFTLTVNGTDFVPGAVVNWNGSARATTFVNNTQVTAQITAADVATQGLAGVTVVNPAPGGGSSNALTFNITPPNPVPVLTSLTPNTAGVGGPTFTLTVQGNGFVQGSTVNWNGSARPTTFLSATQLSAQVSASDIASVGSASVTVVTPAPGGGLSNALTFTISAQPNPVPAIITLSPSSALAGDEPFTLVVTGSNFVAGSVVQWNGGARPTMVVSATELRAQISAADVASASDVTITVVNPAPGGGASNTLTFTINQLNCQVICLQSSQYYLNNISKLPRGYVFIGGVNFNNPLPVQNNVAEVRRALQGGGSPLQMLNQQYVAAQLSLLVANGPFGSSSASVLNSSLRCFGVNFTPTQLDNGFTLSRSTTFGELMSQSRSAITSNRTSDMAKLAAVLALLNGNDPTDRCQ